MRFMKPPYGAWIDINGKVTDIGMCQHTQYLSYSDADDEGWICVVYGNKLLENSDTSSFFVRLNPNTVKEPALKALLKLINQTDKEQYMFSDMFQRDFPGHNNAKRGKTKMEARKFIRDIASDKINQERLKGFPLFPKKEIIRSKENVVPVKKKNLKVNWQRGGLNET